MKAINCPNSEKSFHVNPYQLLSVINNGYHANEANPIKDGGWQVYHLCKSHYRRNNFLTDYFDLGVFWWITIHDSQKIAIPKFGFLTFKLKENIQISRFLQIQNLKSTEFMFFILRFPALHTIGSNSLQKALTGKKYYTWNTREAILYRKTHQASHTPNNCTKE